MIPSGEKPVSRISVRNLVEFLLRSGDLDNRVQAMPDTEAMQLGAKIHRKLQKSREADYEAEVTLSQRFEFEELTVRIEGRADGLVRGEIPLIEEIKGVARRVDDMESPAGVHLAQAKCYAAMLLHEEGQTAARIRMTYVHLDTEEIRQFEEEYAAEELFAWILEIAEAWYRWALLAHQHKVRRNTSVEALEFPFPYRPGQRRLVGAVYHALHSDGKELFIEAPTGVGKTMSVVFPAVRTIGEGLGERLFYLTSKTITRTVGLEAFSILQRTGLVWKLVVITAKEKICPMSEVSCNPEDCPYAKGHFDRINETVFSLLQTEFRFDREMIERAAREGEVCPFELSLELSAWADGIICDYNYVFDPNAHLRRFFSDSGKKDSILLIDEAHNLVERGREMYSASLVKEHVLSAKRFFKDKSPRITKTLERVNRLLLAERKRCEEEAETNGKAERDSFLFLEQPEAYGFLLLTLLEQMQEYFEEHRARQGNGGSGRAGGPARNDEDASWDPLAFYFEVRDFLDACDRFTERYVCCAVRSEEEFAIRVICVDPSNDLQEYLDLCCGAVFFSATLLPISYYVRHLTARENVPAVYAESPFSPKNRCILIGSDVTTRYRARGAKTYDVIARYIHDTAEARTGNYIAFFPSYKMMEEVLKAYRSGYDTPGINWVAQSRFMGEEDREMFLENFYEDPRESLIAFCVMGGIFSEGIDLTGSRLIGAIVVGTGLPQVGSDREILREAYDRIGEDGFRCAYRVPGMNRVLQAAGRVIRTDSDRGVILLLDDRFLGSEYRGMFPKEWSGVRTCRVDEVGKILEDFWHMPENLV